MLYIMEDVNISNNEYLLGELFNNAYEMLWFIDPVSKEMRFSKSFYSTFGYEQPEIMTLAEFTDMVFLADRQKFRTKLDAFMNLPDSEMAIEHRLVCRNGEKTWVFTKIKKVLLKDNVQTFIMGSISNIDEDKKKEHEKRQKSHQDRLTGLPSRLMLEYRLWSGINAYGAEKKLALVHIEINNYKQINDSYGYSYGDAILKHFASLLPLCFSKQDSFYKTGSDDFVVLIDDIGDRDEIRRQIEKAFQLLRKTLTLNGKHLSLVLSAGIAVYPEDGVIVDELMSNAAAAMNKAKENDTDPIYFYSKEIKEEFNRRKEMENRLKEALDAGEFFLVYQPQVDIPTGRVIGVEALVRWRDKENGIIPPSEFIPMAESTGLIIPLGLWVLEAACSQVKKWKDQGLFVVSVSVNISSIQIRSHSFFNDLKKIIQKTGIDPAFLELEITESIFIESNDIVRKLFEKIRKLGVRIALDDFGTGYSSLNYLKNIPLDRLKIDKSFINDMKPSSVEKAIAGTIVMLAHILNLEVVAEGVETEEQYRYLQKVGCNVVQGYYLGKPTDPDAVQAIIAARMKR